MMSIGRTWDEMLRMVASVKYGEERASRIVSKLAAASHRNKLFRGLEDGLSGRILPKRGVASEGFARIE
jgi:TnpA family transposase